jgi:LCP family protein required for cell wall assembly
MITSELRLRRLRRRRARLRRTLLAVGGAFLLLALVVVSAGVSFYLGIHRAVPGALDPAGTRAGQPITVLVMGVDAGVDIQGSANKRTDTMMLVSFDAKSRRVGILSIPRDTRVPIQGHGQDKVNAANVYGGEALAMRTVSAFLDVPVNYYVLVDLAGFAHIVDTLGGVVVDVPQRMYKVDPNQDLVIDLQPGVQLLDGDHALQFVRFRDYENADLGRIKAQQVFLRALADKAFQLKNVLKLPALFADFARYVDTNIGSGDMMRLARLAAALEPGDMRMGTVPGEIGWVDEVCYYVADPAGTALAVNRLVWGIDVEANARLRVAVYNGTDRAGAARTLADKLRAQGFNVTVVASAPEPDCRATAVYPATGGTAQAAAAAKDAARAVARGMAAIGVPASVERRGPPAGVAGDGSLAQARDATVVVGADLPR